MHGPWRIIHINKNLLTTTALAPNLDNMISGTVNRIYQRKLAQALKQASKVDPSTNAGPAQTKTDNAGSTQTQAVESPYLSTRFMIISDTHDLTLNDPTMPSPFQEPFPVGIDVVIHCGGLTKGGGINNYQKAIDMLGKIKAELKLVIAGSRDLSLDSKFWKEHTGLGECDCDPMESERALRLIDQAKDLGIEYLEEGKHEFVLKSGAYFSVWASPYTPSTYHPQSKIHDDLRAFTYDPLDDTYVDRFQLERGDPRKIPFPDIDILISSGPPDNFLDDTWSPPKPRQGADDLDPPNDLRYVVPRLGPRIHCFGHNHKGYGMRIVDWLFEHKGPGQYGKATWLMSLHTLVAPKNPYPQAVMMNEYGLGGLGTGLSTMFVNASIMDMHNRPTNAPWVLDMDLPNGKWARNEREPLVTLREVVARESPTDSE